MRSRRCHRDCRAQQANLHSYSEYVQYSTFDMCVRYTPGQKDLPQSSLSLSMVVRVKYLLQTVHQNSVEVKYLWNVIERLEKRGPFQKCLSLHFLERTSFWVLHPALRSHFILAADRSQDSYLHLCKLSGTRNSLSDKWWLQPAATR